MASLSGSSSYPANGAGNMPANPANKANKKYRIKIRLSRQGLYFLVLNLTMLIAGLNFANANAVFFSLLCLNTGLISSYRAWRNNRTCYLEPGPIAAVYAGQAIRLPLCVHASGKRVVKQAATAQLLAMQCSIRIEFLAQITATEFDAPIDEDQNGLFLTMPAMPRGIYPLLQITLQQRCPLGLTLFNHSLLYQQCICVYPAPADKTDVAAHMPPNGSNSRTKPV